MACTCLCRSFIRLGINEAMKSDVHLWGTAVHKLRFLQLASTSSTHPHFTRISFERCSVCSSLRALCNLLSSFSLRALLSRLLERYTFSCKRVQQVGGSEQLFVSEHHSELTKRRASLEGTSMLTYPICKKKQSSWLMHLCDMICQEYEQLSCMKDTKRCHSPLVSSSAYDPFGELSVPSSPCVPSLWRF